MVNEEEAGKGEPTSTQLADQLNQSWWWARETSCSTLIACSDWYIEISGYVDAVHCTTLGAAIYMGVYMNDILCTVLNV